jgi:tetratricopeptide (TPR) repeat protein
MASVFLSYHRGDLDRAGSIALSLERAGHSVWWDRDIKGGAQYSNEIDKALKAADAVVVLWSERSIESAWVRDEAAAGRDSGRLVPVRLDQAEPPLGFRQYQTLDLSKWQGRGKTTQFRTLLDAVEALPGGQPVISPAGDGNIRTRRVRSNWQVLAAGLIAAGLALVAFVLWNPFSTHASLAVAAVVPADSSAASRDFARDLLAKLGSVHSASGGPVELVSSARRNGADLVFEVSGSTEAGKIRANVVLMKGRNESVLWAKDFSRAAKDAGDLRQQLSYTTAQVLSCALEALPRGRSVLKSETLKLYLKGCADLTDMEPGAASDLVPLFREVIAAAPTFEAGWSKMLLAAADDPAISIDEQTEKSRLLREQVRKDVVNARLLNPELAAAYAVEITLLPLEEYARRLNLADRATAANRNDPIPYSFRSSILFSVGRLKEAIDDAQLAAQLNPLSPRLRELYIGALADSGRLEAALRELQKAEQLWPDSSSLAAVRFRIHLRYGDPLLARQLIRSGAGPASRSNFESFLQARIDPTPSNVERAIGDARALYKRDNSAWHHLVQTLSIFHRESGALLMRVPLPEAIWITDVMFRPAAREFWRDPRSLAYAKRVGLLQYWHTSGKWPDFCYETDLPYACEAEAAKLLT